MATGRALGGPQTDLAGWVLFAGGGTLVRPLPDARVIQVWDAATRKRRRAIRLPEDYGPLLEVAVSPDGQTLTTQTTDRSVRVWDLSTGVELRRWDCPPQLWELRYAPDGKSLAGCGGQENRILLWELETGRERARWEAGSGFIPSGLQFSPDGMTLAFIDHRERKVELREASTGRRLGRLPSAPQSCLAFSPDGKAPAVGSFDNTVVVWDVAGLLGGRAERAAPLSARELETLWGRLRSADAAAAYQAMCRLVSAPTESVPFLQRQLRRASAAPDPGRISRLILDLDSDRFAERGKAHSELEKLGAAAEPALRKALEGQPPTEVRRRVRDLLNRLERSADPAERLRLLRAIEVLEGIGTPEGRQVLEALSAGGWGSRVAREAKASLQRLARRPTSDR